MSCVKNPWRADAREAAKMLEAVEKAGVKHMVGFNYRFVPALRQARQWIEAGLLGEIFHFRAVYLQEWITDPSFPMSWRMEKAAPAAALSATWAPTSSTWPAGWSASRPKFRP